MSYHVTNENSFLDIKNAHLRVTGNVHTDVLKLGAIEVVAAPYQPTSSEVLGTTNFTNVTTGVTTSSNLIVGGVLSIGTVEVIATTHTLANTTAKGSVTPHTIEFSNVTTGLITTANVSVGRDLTVTGNVLISDDLTVTGNALVSSNLTVTGNVSVSDDLTVTGNVSVSDDLTVTGAASVSNVVTIGTTKTFVVTMTNASGANKYYIDGYLQASLVLHQHQTYIFDLSSGTLSGHPFEFSTTNNGSHGGGSVYSTGITTTGTYASSEKRTFVVSASTPTTLYYYCTAHSGMGGSVSISSEAELIVSGGAEFLGTGTIKLPSGTTDQRPATGINGMIRYNSTTGYMEAYTVSGWGSIATPPTIQTISPTSVAVNAVTTQVVTVTGAFFDAQTTIQLQGGNGTKYNVTDFTFTNYGSIGFKMGNLASGQVANRPFTVVVTNGAGLNATSAATLNVGGVTWTSPAAGATLTFSTLSTVTNTELAATDDLGGSGVTYSVPANNLSGLTLNPTTGAITGTIGAAGTTSVTFRATDTVSGATLDRTFSIVGVNIPAGQQTFTTTGTTAWIAPSGVTSVFVVCVGGGGGGGGWYGSGGAGGGLAWRNNVTVVPGTSYTVTVGTAGSGRPTGTNSPGSVAGSNGGTSSFLTTVAGGGQHGGPYSMNNVKPSGGTFTGDGGGIGGTCEGNYSSGTITSGGGGAGGYSGTGGKGGGSAISGSATFVNATAGAGGGGGGGGGRLQNSNSTSDYGAVAGGGVGLNGQGANGAAGVNDTFTGTNTQVSVNVAGGGGSGGARGSLGTTPYGIGGVGGLYGGGGGPATGDSTSNSVGGPGGKGAVRIIWGTGRSFPTNAADV